MKFNNSFLVLLVGVSPLVINAEEIIEQTKKKEKQEYERLDIVNIYGDMVLLDGSMTDEQGYDAIFEDNYSSDYVGKKRIEAYRGTTPSDLLSSFAGIYSGDSRNSGALDPNIRGIQAEGRIKTRIDGSEQAITVYRGYNGSSNRNYIDPMLTSSIRVVKDSGLDTGVQTGIGGGIEIRTLDVNDFIGDEGGLGGEIRIESSSNSKKVTPGIDYDGYHTDDIPNYDSKTYRYYDNVKNLYSQKHSQKSTRDQLNVFRGNDYAARIALGYKGEYWDVMAALATRKRGNYFSGKNNSSFYNQDDDASASYNYSRSVVSMAQFYKPGEEVFNTSSATGSYLFKTNWRPTNEHKFTFNARRTKSLYGEIMPKQVIEEDGYGVQWPLSDITADAFSLQYMFNPSNNDYVNLKTNLWMTKTDSDLYNSAGNLLTVDRGNGYGGSSATGKGLVKNNARNYVNHTRKGIDVSNSFVLNNKVGVTAFASLQDEDLNSTPKFWGPKGGDWSVYPRVGNRREYDLGFNVNWQVSDQLTLDVGAKYLAYRKHDTMLEKALADPDNGYYQPFIKRAKSIEAYEYEYKARDPQKVNDYLNSSEYAADVVAVKEKRSKYLSQWDKFCGKSFSSFSCRMLNKKKLDRTAYANNKVESGINSLVNIKVLLDNHVAYWYRGANGKFNREDSPCLNGKIVNTPGLIRLKSSTDPKKCDFKGMVTALKTAPIDHVNKKDHSWVPSIAANYQINDNSRIYARYNESVRFPSLFEGLLGSGGKDSPLGLKPEHSYKFELGYTHNFTDIFSNAEVANLKLAYYQNTVKDVIDRSNFLIKNFDRKSTRGLELQGRYDNGKYFADLGVNYTIKNVMCDQEYAALAEDVRQRHSGKYPDNTPVNPCTDTGHLWTYMSSHAVPKLATKLHIGGRFFDNKLTLGSRITYYSAFDSSSFDEYMSSVGQSQSSIVDNSPYGWDKTLLIDAYARYDFNQNFMLEFSGNNLTDQYYIDPASRTTMPGPGRTFKIGFTGRF